MRRGFWWEDLTEGGHLENLGLNGVIILKMDLQKVGWGGGIEWIDLAQAKGRWQAVVNTVMNFRVQ